LLPRLRWANLLGELKLTALQEEDLQLIELGKERSPFA
jgi:hypothetical protein